MRYGYYPWIFVVIVFLIVVLLLTHVIHFSAAAG